MMMQNGSSSIFCYAIKKLFIFFIACIQNHLLSCIQMLGYFHNFRFRVNLCFLFLPPKLRTLNLPLRIMWIRGNGYNIKMCPSSSVFTMYLKCSIILFLILVSDSPISFVPNAAMSIDISLINS